MDLIERYKSGDDNIENGKMYKIFTKGLDFVKQLNPVSYNFKKSREDDTPHGNKRYGFLAQDILALEGEDNVIIDNEQVDHLKYQGEALVPVLVKAIQELKAEVDSLKAQINGASA